MGTRPGCGGKEEEVQKSNTKNVLTHPFLLGFVFTWGAAVSYLLVQLSQRQAVLYVTFKDVSPWRVGVGGMRL